MINHSFKTYKFVNKQKKDSLLYTLLQLNWKCEFYTQKKGSVEFTKANRLKWLKFYLISPENLFTYYTGLQKKLLSLI